MTGRLTRMFLGEPFGGVLPGARGAVLAALMRTDAQLTGRQVHALVGDRHSLWTVQQALKELAQLGLTQTRSVGRAGLHGINENHVAVAPMRMLLSPIDVLVGVVRDVVGEDVEAVVVYGSVARGESTADSDVDLAVVAPESWDRRVELEDAVRNRLGNDCDVLHLTAEDLTAPPGEREPVVDRILSDGIALIGVLPRRPRRAAS